MRPPGRTAEDQPLRPERAPPNSGEDEPAEVRAGEESGVVQARGDPGCCNALAEPRERRGQPALVGGLEEDDRRALRRPLRVRREAETACPERSVCGQG